MAIDTAEKRRSASGVKRLGARVTPNVTKDQEWRQQVGWVYSGILAGEPSGEVAKPRYRGFAVNVHKLINP